MRFSRLVSSFLFTTSVACSAIAAPVFLVQLGSFTSKEQSAEHWQKLQSELGSELQELDFQVSEVSLPPSGKSVYRLQAGPLLSRLDALSLCSKFDEVRQDCFVVESATFTPEARNYAANTPSIPSTLPASLPEVVDDVNLEDLELDEPVVEEVQEEIAAITREEYEEIAPKADEVSGQSGTISLLEEDDDSTPLPWETAAEAAPQKVEMAQMEQPAPVAAPAIPPAAVKPPLKRPDVMPLPSRTTSYTAPRVEQVAPTRVRPSEAPRPLTVPQEVAANAPRPVVRSTNQFATPKAATRPMRSETINAPSPIKADTSGGKVEVAEAIPVPLSDDVETTTAAPVEPSFIGRRAQGWGASPSKSFMQKTVWAKVQYFAHSRAAQQFWMDLRKQYPNMTNKLRARITKPLQQRNHVQRVSLQFGPFLTTKDLQTMCGVIKDPNLKCFAQRDLGPTIEPKTSRYTSNQKPRYKSSRDYALRGRPQQKGTQYWVQLGTYSSKAAAFKAWNQAKIHYTYSLENKLPHVEQPMQSSSPRPVYRLRTGPFAVRYGAQQLCDTLIRGRRECVVVSD